MEYCHYSHPLKIFQTEHLYINMIYVLNFLKNLSKNLERFCEHKHHKRILFWWTFAEASFLPIPQEPYMAMLQIYKKYRWYDIASYTILATILGASLGYFIGFYFYDFILRFYISPDTFVILKDIFDSYGVLAIVILSFMPFPSKVISISAGIFSMNFILFLIVSTVFRSIRIYVFAFLVEYFGFRVINLIKTMEKSVVFLIFLLVILLFLYVIFV